MPLYKVSKDKLDAVTRTSFVEEKFLERRDLQRLLRADISALGDDLMVIAEEFREWDGSKLRIDLLCLDKQRNLVVVELKRTEDGGHMELQAIRYAAMVSNMTLDQAIDAYAKFSQAPGVQESELTARRGVLEFLNLESTSESMLTGKVRIVLVSEDFSTALTTSVLWLNRHEVDITCVRLKPYRIGDELLIDVDQIIPLPEAADYEIKVRAQAQEIKKFEGARQATLRRFWGKYIEHSKAKKIGLYANRSASADHWISASIGRSGFSLGASLTEDRARIECYISLGKDAGFRNKTAFQSLKAKKTDIEKTFQGALDWQDLPDRIGCRICVDIDGGWKTPEDDWPALQDEMLEHMMRLESALKTPIQALDI